MSEKNRNIDELFRQELGNATEVPPSSVWDTLEQRLDQASPAGRRMRIPYRLFAVFLVALIATYFLYKAEKDKKAVHKATGAVLRPEATGGKIPAPNQAGTAGAIVQKRQETQPDTATADDTAQAGGLMSTEDNAHSQSEGNTPEPKAAVQAHAPYTKESRPAENGAVNSPAGRRRSALRGKRARQHSNAAQQSGTSGLQASTRGNSGMQRQQTATTEAAQATASETNVSSGSEQPQQQGVTATPEKAGKQARKSGADHAGMPGVAKQLQSGSAHGARSQSAGEQAGTARNSIAAATEQNKAQRKSSKQLTATTGSARAPIVPAAKSGEQKTTKNNIAASEPAQSKDQEKTPGNRKAAETASEAQQAKAITVAKSGKETAVQNNTAASAPAQSKGQEKTPANRKAAEAASEAQHAKAITVAKTGKETAVQNNTAASAPAQSKDQKKTPGKGKAAETASETQPAKAITAAKSGKETAVQNNIAASAPAQSKGQEKTPGNRKAAETASETQQAKAITAAKSGEQKTAKNTTAATDPGQSKGQGKTVKDGQATAATPAGKDQTTALAKTQKETAGQNSANGMPKVARSARGTTAQHTARQAKAIKEPAAQAGIQQLQKEQKAAAAKENAQQNTEDGETAAAGGAGGSGNTLKPAKDKVKRPLNMAIGVKAGYEKGFQSYTANTFVASAFGEVNFSPKISLIVQPGIKLANTSSEYRTANETYIRAGNVQTTMYYEERDSMNFPTGYKNYAYSQTYDSIVAYRQAQKKFTEFELPFMVRYKMDKNLSFLAGMTFIFGKTLKKESVLQYYNGLSLADSIFHFYDTLGGPPSPPGIFAHSGSVPFSSYKDPGVTEVINRIRFGYTIGVSYTIRQRLIFDLTLQQNLSRLSEVDDEQIKKLFTQPYIRLSVGYSIFGHRK